jgi:hypothetical protein
MRADSGLLRKRPLSGEFAFEGNANGTAKLKGALRLSLFSAQEDAG